jgi:hypothetical protein
MQFHFWEYINRKQTFILVYWILTSPSFAVWFYHMLDGVVKLILYPVSRTRYPASGAAGRDLLPDLQTAVQQSQQVFTR